MIQLILDIEISVYYIDNNFFIRNKTINIYKERKRQYRNIKRNHILNKVVFLFK